MGGKFALKPAWKRWQPGGSVRGARLSVGELYLPLMVQRLRGFKDEANFRCARMVATRF
jgi:hypothetical protein